MNHMLQTFLIRPAPFSRCVTTFHFPQAFKKIIRLTIPLCDICSRLWSFSDLFPLWQGYKGFSLFPSGWYEVLDILHWVIAMSHRYSVAPPHSCLGIIGSFRWCWPGNYFFFFFKSQLFLKWVHTHKEPDRGRLAKKGQK